ncbi:MAG: hypothetical protein HYW07_15355 [Candidatus Latescibacteria bacterium]|nr:hypothetical protein [Candidatus Latescibacterota bacterium]
MVRLILAAAICLLAASATEAQVAFWKLGGSGLKWSESDTTGELIDFDEQAKAIRPRYFTPEQDILPFLKDWSELRVPRELGFVDGLRPRLWTADGVGINSTSDNTRYVDGDRTTYNSSVSSDFGADWFTVDLGVPVPAERFGFLTPSTGYRADGAPLSEDFVPAFEVSISPDTDPVVQQNGYFRLQTLIAEVRDNFAPEVHIEFPRQYVRYIRYRRTESIIDASFGALDPSVVAEFNRGVAARGSIAEFVLYGQGVPRRVIYLSKILDLGREVNFGRLFWNATPMRWSEGELVEVPQAQARAVVETRTGRDGDPNVYHEFTEKGKERVVSRERYEKDLQPPADGQPGKPGLRAPVGYDAENWSFWSSPTTLPGQSLGLQSGSHLQLTLTLESGAFADFVRLDSLWIEVAPLLARRVVGELARLDDLQPARGFTEVELGETVDFACDLRAEFTAAEPGFDALRLRTGHASVFERLELGQPLVQVEPAQVIPEAEGLVIVLPEKITRTRNLPIRVVFSSRLFAFASTFGGEVWDRAAQGLPQPIEAGDAGEAINTGSLRVLGGSGQRAPVLQELEFSAPVLTPNGDGINDQLQISYSLFRLPERIPAELVVYALDGRRVASIVLGLQEAGPQRIAWDGRDETGRPLAPGLYLVELVLRAESAAFRQLRPVGVAY